MHGPSRLPLPGDVCAGFKIVSAVSTDPIVFKGVSDDGREKKVLLKLFPRGGAALSYRDCWDLVRGNDVAELIALIPSVVSGYDGVVVEYGECDVFEYLQRLKVGSSLSTAIKEKLFEQVGCPPPNPPATHPPTHSPNPV